MKKRILRNLHEYHPNFKDLIGKKVCFFGDYSLYRGDRLDEMTGTLYGTVNSFCSKSITLGDFVDIHTVVDFADHERAIRFLESLEALKVRRDLRVELTDRLEAYVIDFSKQN
jgi:hypothetical protein